MAVKTFPVSDSGYDPYSTVLATSDEMLRKNPDAVKSMVAAVRDGWRAYLDDPKATNEKMHQMNPSMEAGTFAEVAESAGNLLSETAAGANGLGTMTKSR